MIKPRTTQTGSAKGPAVRQGEAGLEVLDRLIADALVGAMILLGFALCLGAARAETRLLPADPVPALHLRGA
ncbi:MAG: hypothetical protein U1E62_25985 [Alsobacter sp.]